MWAYDPDICDGDYCPMNCDYCHKSYDREEDDSYEVSQRYSDRSMADSD